MSISGACARLLKKMIVNRSGYSPCAELAISSMKRLWNLSLVNKVFFSYFAVALLLILGFYFSSSSLIRDFYITTLSGRMEQEAHLLGRVLPFGVEGDELDSICRQLAGELGSRITVISLDGRVLGDSAEASAN